MIIDCHVHLNRYNDEQPTLLEDRYELLKQEMATNGIDYALVLSSYKVNDERPGVDRILEVVGDDPQIGVVAGVSYLDYRASDLAHLRSLLHADQIKGLKLYPGYEPFYVHDPRMRVVYQLAAEFEVPVMIHTGDTYTPQGKVKYAHPLTVDEVAVDFREVTFVICHIGNPWVTDAMEVIYKNENVVGDISGLTLGPFEERFSSFIAQRVRDAIIYAGNPRSLLFGTDWPICDIDSYLRFVEGLELTPDETERILYKNTLEIFKLPFGEEGARE